MAGAAPPTLAPASGLEFSARMTHGDNSLRDRRTLHVAHGNPGDGPALAGRPGRPRRGTRVPGPARPRRPGPAAPAGRPAGRAARRRPAPLPGPWDGPDEPRAIRRGQPHAR